MPIAQVRTFEAPERPAPGPWKPSDLERFPDDGYQYEIWHGELVRMAPEGGRHGECETMLIVALGVQLGALGRVYSGDTGFILRDRPADLVSPDLAFVCHDRLPPAEERERFLRVVPDLAVEIRSPTDPEADRAIFEIHMATALRFDTVFGMPLAALDRISGKVTVETKGGKLHHGKLDPKAMSHVRRYLRIRPETDCPDLFVTGEGKCLSYWGGRGIWRRMQKRSGVKRIGSHLIRHSYAQHMAVEGAPVADIQDVLGHESDKMARHYAGEARKRQAAEIMAKYSLAS